MRVAFIDDHPALLMGVSALFAADSRYEVVGTASSADDAVDLVENSGVDVAVVDLSMPGNIFDAIGTITKRCPNTWIVVFTAYANIDLAMRAFEAGAHAFVLKGRPIDDLHAAIEAVRGDEIFVSPGFAEKLLSQLRNKSKKSTRDVPKLTRREQQLVALLLKGMTNRQIAENLGLTEKTIKYYMSNLMAKLGVKNRVEVVLAAKSQGDNEEITDLRTIEDPTSSLHRN